MNDVAMTIVNCGEYQVSVWLHTSEPPPPASWAEGVKRISDLKRQLNGDVSKMLTLAVSDGGAPNSVQRGQLFIEILEGKSKAAAISGQLSNRILRGIATAISWLSPNFRAFPPEQFDNALVHLGLQDHREILIENLLELQKSVAPVATLAAMADEE